MNRRRFLSGAASAAVLARAPRTLAALPASPRIKRPRAISMWEFSWIERRWSGAGYEDWDQALDGLVERGYNAVRIDPFPHLLAAGPHRAWTLWPEWNTQLWGSPDVNRITLLPALTGFLARCRRRQIRVGLSTWYRKDDADTRMQITTPGKPQLKDNIFSYKDAKGEKHYIAASRVREVEPASLAAKEVKIKPSSPPAPPKSKRHWYYLWLF